MHPLAKILMAAGALLVLAGLVVLLAGKIPWLGKLPGDIVVRRGNFTFYFPLTTCLLVSVVLGIVLWLIRR